MNVINFYSTTGDYGYMSNFAHYPVVMNGKTYRTSEHYFQSQKFIGTNVESKIRETKSPKEAAKLGRSRDYPLRKDWQSVKVNVMKLVVLAKFQQNEDIAKLLVETGDAKLVEHTENDSYWGDGGNGKGKNMLGQILMEVRSILTNV